MRVLGGSGMLGMDVPEELKYGGGVGGLNLVSMPAVGAGQGPVDRGMLAAQGSNPPPGVAAAIRPPLDATGRPAQAGPIDALGRPLNIDNIPMNERGGYAQGLMNAQKIKSMQTEDRFTAAKTDVLTETQGWKRKEVQKEEMIQAGMKDASERLGYEGVISFLQKNDPERALDFTKKKVALDRDIMSNDVFKAVGDKDKAEAMAEAYGQLGKMGMALMKAPPDQRNDMYKLMQPMVKAINPNAPETLNQEAVNMLTLGVYQGMPQSIAYGAAKEQAKAQSKIGKLNADIANTEDPTQLKYLQAEREKLFTQAAVSGATLARQQLQMENVEQGNKIQKGKAADQYSKQLAASSKDFILSVDTYTEIQGSLQELARNPNNSFAQIALSRGFVKAHNKGPISDPDAKIGFADYGTPALKKKMDSMLSGKVVHLDPEEIRMLKNQWDMVAENKLKRQQAIEAEYERRISSYNGEIKWADIRKPTQEFYEYRQKIADELRSQEQGAQFGRRGKDPFAGVPPEIKTMATDALNRGAPMEKVQQRIQQIMQQMPQPGAPR